MLPLLLYVAAAGLLATSSLLVMLFRVSPLTAPAIAIPGLFLSGWLAIASLVSLLAYGIWSRLSVEGMDIGSTVSIALREGAFVATTAALLLLFHILGIFTWWIALLIALVFVLVELALLS